MTSPQDGVREEQGALESLYKQAEELARQLDGPVQAATSASAKAAQEVRLARLEQLEVELQNVSQLIAIGRVDFDGGTHAGRTVYIGRVLIGDPEAEYPPMSSWKAEIAGAFYNPLGFEGGDVVDRKRSLIGRDRTVHDVIDERPRELRAMLERNRTTLPEPLTVTTPTLEPEADPQADPQAETVVAPDVALADEPGAEPSQEDRLDPRPAPRANIPVRPRQPQTDPSRMRVARPKDATPSPSDRPQQRPAISVTRAARAEEETEVREPAAALTPQPNGAEGGLVDPLIRRLLDRQGTQLAPIVETIQARQYELMERPLDRTLVIQGGPGTGKTIIALHRIAVQLFRSRGAITQSDILFVGPSRTFVQYVDKVLPSLGDSNVIHRAIQDLATHGAVAGGHDPADVALVKGLPQMAEVIDRFLRGRARIDRRNVRLGIGALSAVSPDALQPVLDEAKSVARNYGELRARFRERLNADATLRALSSTATAGERVVLDAGLADALAEDTVPTLSPRAVIHELLTSPLLMESAAEGLLTAAQQATIRRRAATVGQHPWSFEDFPLLDEASEQLGSDRRPRRYTHVVIDEAQDFSAMQLRMLRRRAGGGITVLGDLAQASTGWAPATWDEHLGSGGIEVDDLEELALSYRTTRPILEAANRLLIVIDLGLEPPHAVIPDGAPVQAVPLGVPADDAMTIAAIIAELSTDSRSEESIGLIGPLATLERVRPELISAGLQVSAVADQVSGPLVMVPVDDAKGLEFDHVILLEPERIHRSDPATGPRKLYVAMTRARTSLTLLNRDRLPRVLDELAAIRRLPPIAPPQASVVEDGGASSETVRAALGSQGQVAALPDDEASAEGVPVRLKRRLPAADPDAAKGIHREPGPCLVPTGRGEIVLTDHPGLDRRDLIVHAEGLGLAVRPDVTPTTSLVVVGRSSSTSRRARIARDLKVPIATAEALLATAPGGEIEAEVQPSP